MMDYPKINKKCPAYAIIINNQYFVKTSANRDGSDKDVKSIKQLKSLNISFEHTLTDLTADEMVGALTFLATKDSETISIPGHGIGALKLLNFSKEQIEKVKGSVEKMKGILDTSGGKLKSFHSYSCLMVFILTHGSNDGVLKGRDLNEIPVEKLSEIFNSERCKDLAGKPKIFFIQACRGANLDELKADDDANNDDDKDDQVTCKLYA